MKCYNSIENLPLYNYSKITENNDLRYLLILNDYFELPDINEKKYEELLKIWEKISDEIIDYNGISDEYLSMLRQRKAIALLKVEMVENKDKSLENIIELKEKELINYKPKNKQNIEDIVVLLEDIKKREINIYTTTLKKYFAIIKSIKK